MAESILELDGARIPRIGFDLSKASPAVIPERLGKILSGPTPHLVIDENDPTEGVIGTAIYNSGLTRADIFVSYRLKPKNHKQLDILWALRRSLDLLRLAHVDLVILDSTSPSMNWQRSLDGLHEAVSKGLAEHLGISRMDSPSHHHVADVSSRNILCNHIEHHPFINQSKTLATAQELGTAIFAHSPLARGAVNMCQEIWEIAQEVDRSCEQVALRWLIQQDNVVALPRITEFRDPDDLQKIYDFELSPDQMSLISNLRDENLLVGTTNAA